MEYPVCDHARRGIVTSGDHRIGPHAATNVCDRPDCIEDAMWWATGITKLPAEYRPDRPLVATSQGRLF